ncbi:MAG: aminomethyl-transferring glycine dehydrogenase [Ilumatobacteraceae bacterium]
MRPTLTDLLDQDQFTRRHLGLSDADRAVLLDTLGLASVDALVAAAVPAAILQPEPLALPGPRTETDVLAELRSVADQNQVLTSLIGQGYFGTVTPPVILRNVLENPAWYTAYTPYQPEISQGRLETLVNFQTMISDLTGMELASASLLDEATAAAEAMTMARRLSRSGPDVFFVDADTQPQTIAVLATRAEPLGIELQVAPIDALDPTGCYGALLSWPGSSGELRDLSAPIAALHEAGAIAVVTADLLGCTIAEPPGSRGADIVVGSAQRFGVPMGFGGPHAGFLATKERHARSLPGRLVGVSTDTAGRPALRLALQTREQHIRREKATSNICTAQVLLANIASLYAAYHGPEGLQRIAERTHRLASVLVAGLRQGGVPVHNSSWFDTVTVSAPGGSSALMEQAVAAGFNLRRLDDDRVGISFDETTTPAVVESLWTLFGVSASIAALDLDAPDGISADDRRTTALLPQAAFNRYHTEHEMLRYLRRLADKDLALDRTMIPLGSCTMKLNATSEMEPITWPEFANVHPYAPIEQTLGYRHLIRSLEQMLVAITGYDAVSLQPNAGSQGELAGLLAIRAYHRSQGDDQRTVCLIPSSAHGTNAASAVMAGMRVTVVACDDGGNVDLDDLRAKAAAAGDQLAAIMVTYPSTHGVYEAGITELCEIVHGHGGQVYVDGANLNALVGLAQPGRFGADVSHLNLHKTFCIPHGGGGPGVGPVAVRAHLAPFLPGDPLAPLGTQPVGPVSAAQFGSASILPISWVYISLMGGTGLRAATVDAVLAANYVARRLDPYFPVLYTGANGLVAHECILDVRPITKATGVTVDDIAKRLIDFGFHAPTMSFPVAGTLMVEPTESESLAELDRFVAAMVAIHAEIEAIAQGADLETSALRHAPHTAEDLLGDWDRPYGRADGAFPVASLRRSKYFPPVSRIDSAYGDRHLVCSCEPIEAYAEAH